MKRGVVVIFLLLTTLVFAEESQIDEARELRERVVKLETIIERMEKERLTSIDYYESSFEDSKEYYKNTLEDSKYMYENGLSSVRWTVGISSTILGMVMAILGIILAWVKISSDKKLEAEKKEIMNDLEKGKKEIKKSSAEDLQGLKDENKKLLDEMKKVKLDMEEREERLNKQDKEIQNKFNLMAGDTELLQAKNHIPEVNSGNPFAISYFIEGITNSLESYLKVDEIDTEKIALPLCELIRAFDECSSVIAQDLIASNLLDKINENKDIKKIFSSPETFENIIRFGPLEIGHRSNISKEIKKLFEFLEKHEKLELKKLKKEINNAN